MTPKDMIKKPGFWAAVSAFIVLVLNLTGVKAEEETVNRLIMGICSVLIVIGVLSAKEAKKIDEELQGGDKEKDKEENKDDKG